MQTPVLGDILKNTALGIGRVRSRHLGAWIERGYDPERDEPAYVSAIFKRHAQVAEPVSGRVLEIGPGGNIGVAALFAAHGASEAWCIDIDPWRRDSPALYAALGLTEADLARVRYDSPVAVDEAAYPDKHFQFIYSHAAFQHFPDPVPALQNIFRLLAPGGRTSHWIDLRDLRDASRPLRFLRHGDFVWRLMSSNRVMGTNRWRSSDYEQAFAEVGFEDLHIETTFTAPVADADRRAMARRFRGKSLEDLARTAMWISAQRPLGS